MKNIITTLLFSLSLAMVFSQDYCHLVSKTSSGNLNLRNIPSATGTVIKKIPSDNQLIFLNEFYDEWIHVGYTEILGLENIEYTKGWVHRDFIESPCLKPQILECNNHNPFNFANIFECAYGPLIAANEEEAVVFYQGSPQTLVRNHKSKITEYKNQLLTIELLIIQDGQGVESENYSGFVKITQGEREEYIYITLGVAY